MLPPPPRSAVTYLQRYSLRLALWLTTTNADDDGRNAGATVGGASSVITADQAKALEALVGETRTNLPVFLQVLGVKSFAELPIAKHDVAVNLLNLKKERRS